MLTLEMMRNNVRTSAVLLDSEVPGWHEKINTDDLDMNSSITCIAAQLGIDGLPNPDPEEHRICESLDMSYTRGFFVGGRVVTYFNASRLMRNELKQWWLEEIASRKEGR